MELDYFFLVLMLSVSACLGAKVRVTTIEEKPYIIKNGNKYTGFIKDLMDEIAKKENIDYAFQTVRDGRYGGKDDNGEWSGMVGEVYDNEADIAAAPMTMSPQRQEALDFTTPYMEFFTTIITKRPPDGEELKVKTAQQLADQTEIQYGLVRDGETHRYFKSSNKQPYKKMWENMSKNPQNLMTRIDDGIKKVRSANGKYAFIIEGTTADYWTNKEPCDLVKLDTEFHERKYAFAVRKNDALKAKLNRAMKSLQDSGKISELKDKWWNTGSTCNAASTSAFSQFVLHLTWIAALLFYSR